MCEGGSERFERGRTAGDPGPAVDRTEALRERLFGNAVGALELYTIYLGERLGLYRALAESGAATSSQLAVRTGTSERYVREWLEHHAASELLVVDDPRAEPLARRYWLPPEHIPVLANRDDVRYEAGTGVDIVRAGAGFHSWWRRFGWERAAAPAMGARGPGGAQPGQVHQSAWHRMASGDCRRRRAASGRTASAGPRVACGTGWSSIALAQAYPNINVDGLDLDHDAIGAARRNAERAGAADRVRFSVVDAADLGGAGGYDLVTIFEALHDMSRPVDAPSAARRVLADDGTVLVVDGLVAEEFTVPASPRERTEYGWSVVSCLPGAMGDPQTAATGAVMRPSMLHQYALQAGFGAVEVLPIHTDYWRFYRLLR